MHPTGLSTPLDKDVHILRDIKSIYELFNLTEKESFV